MAVFSRYAKVIENDGTAMTVRSALARINEILDQVLGEQRATSTPPRASRSLGTAITATRPARSASADDIARARNTAVETMVRDGILTSAAGKVTLLSPIAMPEDYDVIADDRVRCVGGTAPSHRIPAARGPSGCRRIPRKRAAASRRCDRRRARQGTRVPAVLDRREERLDAGRARVQHRRDGMAGHRAGGALDANWHRRASRVRLRGGLIDGLSDAALRALGLPGVDNVRAASSSRTSSAATSGRTSASARCSSPSCVAIRSASSCC